MRDYNPGNIPPEDPNIDIKAIPEIIMTHQSDQEHIPISRYLIDTTAPNLKAIKGKLPLLSAQIIQSKITQKCLQILSQPFDPDPLDNIFFLQSVKEQILLAQIWCMAASPGSKHRRSTYCHKKVQKLKRRTRWLNKFFLDSTIALCHDERKSRRVSSKRIRQPKGNAYLIRRKRGEIREASKIHKGPISATKTSGSTKMDPQIANTTPSEIKSKPYAKHTTEVPAREPYGADSGPQKSHAYDMIRGILDRATRLAGTDDNTQEHQAELQAIKEDTRRMEEYLGVLSQKPEKAVQTSKSDSYPMTPNRENPVGRGPKQIHNHRYYSRFIPSPNFEGDYFFIQN